MSGIAIYLGERAIHWSAVIITMGALCALSLTLALYRQRSEKLIPVLALFTLGSVLGLFLARLIHWYFNTEIYGSFAAAFTNFDLGSFSIPGVILGVWLAAWIVCKLGLCSDSGVLLDCAAPSMALLIAFIRLSALFNNTCRSRILIENPIFRRLPVAISNTDAAGNVVWRLATFFLAFLAMLLITWRVLSFYVDRGRKKMIHTCSRTGNVWRMFLVYYGAVEIVVDSLRNDSPLMHFHLLSALNQYSSFVSLAQIFAAATALYVLVYYSVRAIRRNGLKFWYVLDWLGFVVSLVGIGYLGEYKVQRTAQYFKCYSIQIVSCLCMVLVVSLMYRTCVSKRRRGPEW